MGARHWPPLECVERPFTHLLSAHIAATCSRVARPDRSFTDHRAFILRGWLDERGVVSEDRGPLQGLDEISDPCLDFRT
jgi:hypothetical protein